MDSVLILIEIVLINVLLSGDNAIVIAMASQQLPPYQRKKAIWWGAAVAVGLRCILIFVALQMLKIPYLQAVGALLLFYIAVKLLLDSNEQPRHHAKKIVTLAHAIWIIFTADFIMSLDNVLAIAAVANQDYILILLGIASSIPMIIWGSQLIGNMLQRFPSLSMIGAGLLAFAAGKMLVNDPALETLFMHNGSSLTQLIPLLCIPLVIIISLLRKRTA